MKIGIRPSGIKQSLSARRAWIEIRLRRFCLCGGRVALRKESVDRNNAMNMTERNNDVALRKESVDRNQQNVGQNYIAGESLSARRAWIEIINRLLMYNCLSSRSPQGERG